MYRESVHLSVNGQDFELTGSDVFSPLSDILRYRLQKTGTKVVCAEGDCGACTVMIARGSGQAGEPARYDSINSCILPAFLADGCHIVTVEGLAKEGKLHAVQRSMVENFGGQCGFCTPGFVMSIANMFERKRQPSEKNIKNYLTGNLCRCTGYQPIIDAVKNVEVSKLQRVCELFPITEVRASNGQSQRSLKVAHEKRVLFAPTTVGEAVEFLHSHPGSRIFSGATDIGVQINKGKDPGQTQLSLHLIKELNELQISHQGPIQVGARVTLSRLQEAMEDLLPDFSDFLNIFASPQIKNSATLVGNLANGSPIADTTPFLMCMDAEVELRSVHGVERKPLVKFFKGYKQLDMTTDQLITGIRFSPPPTGQLRMGLYKVSQRRDLDISSVNACFVFRTESGKVKEAKISYGGVGPTPLRMHDVETRLTGSDLNQKLVEDGVNLITAGVRPLSDLRGDEQFRTRMAGRLFERFATERLQI